MILLDSSILIELFRKQNKEKTIFYSLSKMNKVLSISTITYYEVGIGNRNSHFDYWNSLCETLSIIPFDKTCTDTAIAVYKDLLKANKMIDFADILFGATALAHKIPIATLNVKHFDRIKSLEILK